METHVSSQSLVQSVNGGRINRLQITVIVLCFIFNLLDGFDITVMAVTVIDIGAEMQLAEDMLGLVFSFSLAGMMLGAMFLASLADIFGRRMVILVSLGVVGVSVVFTSMVDSLPELIVLRFVSGLGAGAMLASQAALAAEYSAERYRALAVAVVTAGYPMGAMMTGLLAGLVLPDYGWRFMFLVGGVITIAMVVMGYLLLPESMQFLCQKRPENGVTRINKILAGCSQPLISSIPESSDTSSTQFQGDQALSKKIMKLLSVRYRTLTFLLWSAFFFCFGTMYFLLSWVPKIVIDAGFSQSAGNLAFSLLNFGGVLGVFLLGFLASRISLSYLIFLALCLASLVMGAVAFFTMSESLLLVLIFAIGLLMQGGFTGLYSAAAKIYATDIRSTGVGWGIGLGRFGAVVGPAVAGVMIANEVSLSVMFVSFAIPLFIAGLFAKALKVG